MSRAPGKYVAGAMVPAGAALDRPDIHVDQWFPNLFGPPPLLFYKLIPSAPCPTL
jgi:hypothetical protein